MLYAGVPVKHLFSTEMTFNFSVGSWHCSEHKYLLSMCSVWAWFSVSKAAREVFESSEKWALTNYLECLNNQFWMRNVKTRLLSFTIAGSVCGRKGGHLQLQCERGIYSKMFQIIKKQLELPRTSFTKALKVDMAIAKKKIYIYITTGEQWK